MSETEIVVLADILGKSDAIFWPVRNFSGRLWPNVCESRRAFFRHGAPWASGEADEAGRKESQRTLEGLAAKKFVSCRKDKSKTLFVKLSDVADDAARQVVGLPDIDASYSRLVELSKLSVRPPTLIEHAWISEIQLNRGRGWGDGFHQQLASVARSLLPVMARGWAGSRSTVLGHVYYCVTSAGWDVLGAGRASMKGKPIDFSSAANAQYQASFSNALGRLEKTEFDSKQIGDVPLPVSVGSVPISCWNPE